MERTLKIVEKKPATHTDSTQRWIERSPSTRQLFRAQDDAARRGWFFRFEVTGLYPRRVGPFPTRTDALKCVETLLAEITLGAMLDLHNELASEQACVTEEIPRLTGRTKGR
jgi:hypothetical protein